MSATRPITTQRRRSSAGRGFTLVELLVVILIILLVSAVALPTVIPAIAHRQTSEAARLIQASLAGARDAAIHSQSPRGIRLLPDPAFPFRQTSGLINKYAIMAANRFVPIGAAPDYSEGTLDIVSATSFATLPPNFPPPYPGDGGGIYPLPVVGATGNVLMVAQNLLGSTGANSPTSWFWNLRLGDRIQIGNSGNYYTVVGPMTVTPAGVTINSVFYANPEQFVNDGPPGTAPLWLSSSGVAIEYLFLVNTNDDNANGFVDEGWDGVDNNFNNLVDELAEWEQETWLGGYGHGVFTGNGMTNLTYTAKRRPVPSSNTQEVDLPSNVVVDLTTVFNYQERSRISLGTIDPFTGYVDILLNPDGTVVPSTRYSAPTSIGLGGTFLHLWLAERGDLFLVPTDTNGNPLRLVSGYLFYLPMPSFPAYDALVAANPSLSIPTLKGDRRLITLNTRTGQVVVNELQDSSFNVSNTNQPFWAPQQGVQGGP